MRPSEVSSAITSPSLEGTDAGFCLDLCHAHAAGIPLADGIAPIVEATGRVDLVHVNDSRGEFGSGQDKHANIGDGTIGADVIAAVVAASGADGICETKPEGQAADLIARTHRQLDVEVALLDIVHGAGQ